MKNFKIIVSVVLILIFFNSSVALAWFIKEEQPPATGLRVKKEVNEEADALAMLRINKHRRPYRYMFIGGGLKGDSFTQGVAESERQMVGTATIGMDLSGKIYPLALELRGNFGFSPFSGETAMFTYISIPVQLPGRKIDPSDEPALSKMHEDLESGRSWGEVMLENEDLVRQLCELYSPLKVELGIGYMGINYELRNGNVIDDGRSVRQLTTGMIAGLAYAARISWYGEKNLFRLSGYYLSNKNAENGGKFDDQFFGGTMEMVGKARGTMIEGKLDWYHRLDERMNKGNLLTGYGLSLIGRKITIRESSVTTMRTMPMLFPTFVETIFPEQKVYQVELLATIGFML